jgi:hypothetical protein
VSFYERHRDFVEEPNRDRYHVWHDRKFGDGMRIPDPFDFGLDLSGLVRYPD